MEENVNPNHKTGLTRTPSITPKAQPGVTGSIRRSSKSHNHSLRAAHDKEKADLQARLEALNKQHKDLQRVNERQNQIVFDDHLNVFPFSPFPLFLFRIWTSRVTKLQEMTAIAGSLFWLKLCALFFELFVLHLGTRSRERELSTAAAKEKTLRAQLDIANKSLGILISIFSISK